MEAPHLERKLIAILAADIEGFSRHMERDETHTLATLSSHRIIVDASISEYGGRITGTAGDSVLAEFASVLSAVKCAVQIQKVLAEENAKLAEDRRLLLRIGINVGDVMVKDGDIFGDGVNIAARLETLAEPGGICVSRGVRDHVRKHRIVVFEDLGEQKVKNIVQPIRAFKVQLGAASENDVTDELDAEGTPEHPSLPTQAGLDSAEVELAFWESIKDSKNAKEFEVYLERYPNGPFAVLARSRREGLLDAPAMPEEAADAVAVELAFWESARDSEDVAELEAYIARYPVGEFVTLAKARLLRRREEARSGPQADNGVEAELAFWNTIKDSGNPEMFRAYLHKYPKGTFAELAQLKSVSEDPSG